MDPAQQFFAQLYEAALAGNPAAARALVQYFGKNPTMAAPPLPDFSIPPSPGPAPTPETSGLSATLIRRPPTPLLPSDLLDESSMIQNQPVIGAKPVPAAFPNGVRWVGMGPMANPPAPGAELSAVKPRNWGPEDVFPDERSVPPAPPKRVPLPRNGPQPIPPPASPPAPVSGISGASSPMSQALDEVSGAFGAGDQKRALEQYLKMKGAQPGLAGAQGGGMGTPLSEAASGVSAAPRVATQVAGEIPRTLPIGPEPAPVSGIGASVAETAGPVSRFLSKIPGAGPAMRLLGPLGIGVAGYGFGKDIGNVIGAGLDARTPGASPRSNLISGTKAAITSPEMGQFLGNTRDTISNIANPGVLVQNLASALVNGGLTVAKGIGNAHLMAWDWFNEAPGVDPDTVMSLDPKFATSSADSAPAFSAPEAATSVEPSLGSPTPGVGAPATKPRRPGGMGGGKKKAEKAEMPSDSMGDAGVTNTSGLSLVPDLSIGVFGDSKGDLALPPPGGFPIGGKFAGSPSFGGVNAAALNTPVLGEGRRGPLGPKRSTTFSEGPDGKLSRDPDGPWQGASFSNRDATFENLRRGAGQPSNFLGQMPNFALSDTLDEDEEAKKRKAKVSSYLGKQYRGAQKTGIFD